MPTSPVLVTSPHEGNIRVGRRNPNKQQELFGPHRSPDKPVHINRHIEKECNVPCIENIEFPSHKDTIDIVPIFFLNWSSGFGAKYFFKN